MPIFVHLAPESRTRQIRRNGIRHSRYALPQLPRGVFAVPVTANYYLSHQWLRELKRSGRGPIVAVHFRIHDAERVWVGHYGNAHQEMAAAEAVSEFMSPDAREGWEVIIPRSIDAAEIHRVRFVRQVLGWRYFPTAKGQRPFCACKFCTRGMYGARKLRRRLNPDDE